MKVNNWQIFGIGFISGLTFLVGVMILANIIGGFLQPSPMSTKNLKKVYLDTSVADELNDLYNIGNNEYFVCLVGTQTSGNVRVTGVYEVEVAFANESAVITSGVSGNPCNKAGSLGSIHSHIRTGASNDCDPSEIDIFTFGNMANPEPVINAIQCGNGIFKFMAMPIKEGSFSKDSLRIITE